VAAACSRREVGSRRRLSVAAALVAPLCASGELRAQPLTGATVGFSMQEAGDSDVRIRSAVWRHQTDVDPDAGRPVGF
jgi:hypothetical protein